MSQWAIVVVDCVKVSTLSFYYRYSRLCIMFHRTCEQHSEVILQFGDAFTEFCHYVMFCLIPLDSIHRLWTLCLFSQMLFRYQAIFYHLQT